MFLITIDEKVKDKLLTSGCTLIQGKSDIKGKMIWCLKRAPDFSFDIKSEEYNGKMFAVDNIRLDF